LVKALQRTVQDPWEETDEHEPYHWAQLELRKFVLLKFFDLDDRVLVRWRMVLRIASEFAEVRLFMLNQAPSPVSFSE
jgi:hypothetical protein